MSKKISFNFKKTLVPLATIVIIIGLSLFAYIKWANKVNSDQQTETPKSEEVKVANAIDLPKPSLKSNFSVEAALQSRRSRRDFVDQALSLKQVSQLLWSAQGVTADWGGRTTPSAKSTYPLTVYLLAYNVDKLDPGLYRYIPGDRGPVHQIVLEKSGNLKDQFAAAVGQASVNQPPAVLLITGDMDKMAKAFNGVKHDEDVYLEAGHAAENLYLQVESLNLGMVTVAGFDATKVSATLGLPSNLTIIYAIPVGVPKR